MDVFFTKRKASSIMHGQPDGLPMGICPVDTVFSVRGYIDEIPLTKMNGCLIVEIQPPRAFYYHHPFVVFLIVPARCGRLLAGRDNSFNSHMFTPYQLVE